jgi:CDP-diacylglycerol pyrophosphatase
MAINLTTTLDINEVVRFIQTIGQHVTALLISEPGVGKSSVLRQIAINNGDKWRNIKDNFPEDKYQYVYVDAPNKRDGDLFMMMPERETQSIEQYTTSLINMNDPRPKVIMLDETLKVLKSMKPLFTRLILERCVGDKQLPDAQAECREVGERLGNGQWHQCDHPCMRGDEPTCHGELLGR